MSEQYLGEFEQLVLLAVVRLAEGAYGVPIRREIEKRTDRKVTVGALYSTLDRLEAKGYLELRGSRTPPRSGAGGRAAIFDSSRRELKRSPSRKACSIACGRGCGLPERPPRIAERLLRRLVPGREGEIIAGDLREEFEGRGGGRGGAGSVPLGRLHRPALPPSRERRPARGARLVGRPASVAPPGPGRPSRSRPPRGAPWSPWYGRPGPRRWWPHWTGRARHRWASLA